MSRLREIALRARDTFAWLLRYWRTAPADRFGLVPREIVKAPVCWVRGHDWAGSSICITNYTLQYCQRCGEEIAGRTGFHQIIARPDDWGDPCDDLDFYDDPSPADWDEAHDRAVANGGPF
jgi:hypothetical protein